MKAQYTARQGQYLAFIYYYSKINGRPPAQAEMQRYFGVSPLAALRLWYRRYLRLASNLWHNVDRFRGLGSGSLPGWVKI